MDRLSWPGQMESTTELVRHTSAKEICHVPDNLPIIFAIFCKKFFISHCEVPVSTDQTKGYR